MEQSSTPYYQEDEISLRDIYLKLGEFKDELLKQWLWIIIVAAICAAAGLTYAMIKKPAYIAKTTMMLEGGDKGGMSQYLQLAGEFGLMGGSGPALNEDKLVAIMKSDYAIRSALLKKVEINNKEDYLANFFIDSLDLRKKWEKNNLLKNFTKFDRNDQEQFSTAENKVLQILRSIILDEYLVVESSSEGIISITVATPFELLSQELNLALIEGVSHFYLTNTVQKEKENVEVIEGRLDSISRALSGAENKYATWKDATQRLVKAQGYLEEVRLKRDIEILNRMYGEAIKNLEIAKFTLLQEQPIIQIIDKPYLPLEEESASKLKAILIGAFAGSFLMCGYLILRKIFRDAIKEESAEVNTA